MIPATPVKTRLNGDGDIAVHRVVDAMGQSTIVKTLAENAAPAATAEFAHEQAVLTFLARHCPRFNAYPRIDKNQAGLIHMQDLGNVSTPNCQAYPLSLAQTMADLHRASANSGHAFEQCVGPNAAGTQGEKKFSLEQCRSFASDGLTLLSNIMQTLELRCVHQLKRLSESFFSTLFKPGPFGAVIHHDLAPARQWIEKDNRCYLIDFELAKYSHVLLDLARLQLGSWERDGQDKTQYKIKRLMVSDEFVQCYKSRLFAGTEFKTLQRDFVCQHQDSLLFTLLLNLGVLDVAQERYASQQSLGASVVYLLNCYLEAGYFESQFDIESYRDLDQGIAYAISKINV